MRVLLVTACAAVLVACAAPQPPGIPDDDIGLVKADVTAIPVPPEVNPNASDPGEVAPPPAPYEDAPPVVPHGVGDFLPITREENLCIECHGVAEKVEGEPTPIPPTHYTDLRNAPDEVGGAIVGARWDCTACHAPRTDAVPLVQNRFSS